MLSQTVEYALRAATFMASAPAESHTVEQIAAATRVPVAYLAKVLRQLVRSGVAASRRGVGGGFTLAKPPAPPPPAAASARVAAAAAWPMLREAPQAAAATAAAARSTPLGTSPAPGAWRWA